MTDFVLVNPFRINKRQVWTNYEDLESNIKGIIDLYNILDTLSEGNFIWNIGNSLSEHDTLKFNYQSLPLTLQETLSFLKENLTIINVDPSFIFSQVDKHFRNQIKYIEALDMVLTYKQLNDNLVIYTLGYNNITVTVIFCKTLMPMYDIEGWQDVINYGYDKTIKDNLMLIKPCSFDKEFVEAFYNKIATLINKWNSVNDYTTVFINYSVTINMKSNGTNGKMFEFSNEFKKIMKNINNIHLFEYSNFGREKYDYSCIKLIYKEAFIGSDQNKNCFFGYRPFNIILHTGVINDMDIDIFTNYILIVEKSGSIGLTMLNEHETKLKLYTKYLYM